MGQPDRLFGVSGSMPCFRAPNGGRFVQERVESWVVRDAARAAAEEDGRVLPPGLALGLGTTAVDMNSPRAAAENYKAWKQAQDIQKEAMAEREKERSRKLAAKAQERMAIRQVRDQAQAAQKRR